MRISIRLPLVRICSLFFRKFDLRYFPGDLVALRHGVVLSKCGTKFRKGTILRLLSQVRPGIFWVFAVQDTDRECFKVCRWSVRKLTKLEAEIHETSTFAEFAKVAVRR